MQEVVTGGHRASGATRFHLFDRQDRHELELPRCLVHGHHRSIRGRRLARQRRLHPDGAGNRRKLPGPDLEIFMVQAHDTDNIAQDSRHRRPSGAGGRTGTPRRRRRPKPGGRRRCRSRCRTRERQGHVFLHASGSREAECHAEGRSPAEAERRKTGSRRVGAGSGRCRRSRASPPPPAPKVDRRRAIPRPSRRPPSRPGGTMRQRLRIRRPMGLAVYRWMPIA